MMSDPTIVPGSTPETGSARSRIGAKNILRATSEERTRGSRRRALVPLLVAALLLAFTATASAEEPPAEPAAAAEILTLEEAAAFLRVPAPEIERLAEDRSIPGRRIGDAWIFSREALLRWASGEPSEPHATAPEPLDARALGEIQGAGPEEGEPIGEAPRSDTSTDIFLREQQVLSKRGQLILSPSFEYTRASSPDSEIIFVEGSGVTFSSAVPATQEIDVYRADVEARYGVHDRIEVFGGGTFLGYRVDSDRLRAVEYHEFRDVFVGLRATLFEESAHVPELIVGVRGEVPTGDSSFAAEGIVVAVKSFDPIALFGRVGYRWSQARDFSNRDVTLLEPDSIADVRLGYSFAVSDDITLYTQVTALFIGRKVFSRNDVIDRAQEYRLGLGLVGRIRRNLYLDPSVSFDLGGPEEFVSFELSLYWLPLE